MNRGGETVHDDRPEDWTDDRCPDCKEACIEEERIDSETVERSCINRHFWHVESDERENQ